MIYTIIVNWNLKDDTLDCIDSLIEAGMAPEQIVIVDNGSSDGSQAAFRERYGESVNMIENATNLGYAPACNQGIQFALQHQAGWILLLNNDTLVAPDFKSEMEKAICKYGNHYKILAPVIFYHSDPNMVWYLGDRLIPGTLITTNPYRGKKYHPGLAELVTVDFVSGCAMLVHRQIFEKVGLFDASLIMYGEEIDFCWRARLASYKMACITSAKVWHKISVSADRNKPGTHYLRIRNQVRFYRKYARGLQRPLMFGFSLVRSCFIAAKGLLQKQADLIPATAKGFVDGWWGL